jgi:hypothetical protein
MEPKKRVITKHGNKRWEVDFGLDDNGHRRRPVFQTEADADAAIDSYEKDSKKGGEFWAKLTKLDRNEIIAILQQIKAAGRTLGGVWEDWKRWQKDNQQTTTTPMPYEDVVAEFRKRKLAVGKTAHYVNEVADLFMKFGAGREKQPIHEILPSDLETWIKAQETKAHKPWGLSSKRTNQGRFSSLWSVAKAKGWCSLNIVERLEPVGKIGVTVEVYSNETTLNLMAAVMSNDATKKIIAPMTLGFFGCMRPEEAQHEKFGWDYIDLKNGLVTVSKDVAKTGDQRTIRLQPVAVEWLKLAKELKNPLPPLNERRLVDQCCELIGLKEWIRDGLRKNCATHLRAVYKNDYDVVKDMGNSIRVLLKHYADLHVPEDVSLEHWKISPAKVQAYLKTNTWRNVVETAAKAAYERAAATKQASGEQPKPSANETAKPGS